MVSATITCNKDELDATIAKLESEGWFKDTNMLQYTWNGRVQFEMMRKF